MKIEMTKNEVIAYGTLGHLVIDLTNRLNIKVPTIQMIACMDLNLLFQLEPDEDGYILNISKPGMMSVRVTPEGAELDVETSYIQATVKSSSKIITQIGKWVKLYSPHNVIGGIFLNSLTTSPNVIDTSDLTLRTVQPEIDLLMGDVVESINDQMDEVGEELGKMADELMEKMEA